MSFQNNPFFILRVSCSAGRREIISASDEMSFIADPETCSNALNELITPTKRLHAEINWLVDSEESEAEKIRSIVENNQVIPIDGLSPLSKLNATLYNFSFLDDDDSYELGYSILDIDEQFAALDPDTIVEAINEKRNKAKFGLVQNQDVETEIGKKRDEIRQVITDKLAPMNQDQYVELVTMLAEKCIADDQYEDGIVLTDVIDQYEIRMQSVLEESTESIEKRIEDLKSVDSDDTVSDNLNVLISRVKKWDIIAQPLQLRSKASGMPHVTSEHLGKELRSLAFYLHNERELTNDALKLVNAMKGVFAELGELSDIFNSDSNILNGLLQEEKVSKEVIAELDAIKAASERLLKYATKTDVESFAERIKRLDMKLKFTEMSPKTKNTIRVNLCLLGRGTAIALHNDNHQTSYAMIITQMLLLEFGDIPDLKDKLIDDYAKLMPQQRFSSVRQSTLSFEPVGKMSSSENKGCLIGSLIVIGIIVLIIVIASLSSTPSNNSSGKETVASYNQKSGVDDNSNTSSTAINLSKSNFEDYFTLTTEATFINGKVTISYSISPKNSSYASRKGSSDKIEVEIGVAISTTQMYYYGEPNYNHKNKVTLYKSKGYSSSGSFSFSYSSYSAYVYWVAGVASSSGTIGLFD